METAGAVRPHPTAAGTWAGRVLDGQAHMRYLATADGLRDAAARISAAASEVGCWSVMPASPHAAGAVAAATVLDSALEACDIASVLAGRVDKVVLIETVAVSGLRVRQSASAVSEAGAAWVGAVILFPALAASGDVASALGLEHLDAVLCP